MAWQFHRPEKGDGMVQVYRRPDCKLASRHMPLRGLEANALYEVTVLGEVGKPVRATGRNLLETGMSVTLKQTPQAATLLYRKVK